jgi:hypothetical protein
VLRTFSPRAFERLLRKLDGAHGTLRTGPDSPGPLLVNP